MIKITARSAIFLLSAALILSAVNYAHASDSDDGFGPAQEIRGEHFTIFYAPQVDLYSLIKTLGVSAADKYLVCESSEKEPFYETEIACEIEALFLQISDFLDMHVYSFQGAVKICSDEDHLKSVYRGIFGKELKSHALYVPDTNTIYISPEHFRQEVLGHEIAHAIIGRYFIVQPPERAAEILAGYVEYELKKTNH